MTAQDFIRRELARQHVANQAREWQAPWWLIVALLLLATLAAGVAPIL